MPFVGVLADPALLTHVVSFQSGIPVAVVPLLRRYHAEGRAPRLTTVEMIRRTVGEAIVYYHDFDMLRIVWRRCGLSLHIELCTAACTMGRLDMLQWLYEQDDVEISCTTQNVETSAMAGQLHVLQWLENRFPIRDFLRDLNCLEVVRGGHVNVIRWLLSQQLGRFPPEALQIACEQGNLEILQLLLSTEVPRHSLYDLLIRAVRSGHFRIVEWLMVERNIRYPLHLFYGDHEQAAELDIQPPRELPTARHIQYELRLQPDGEWGWGASTQIEDARYELQQQPNGEYLWTRL